LICLLAACGSQQRPAADRDLAGRLDGFHALLHEQWEYTLEHQPEFASILGDRRYNDRWSDPSPEGVAADLHAKLSFLARFSAVDTTGFPDSDALDLQLMIRGLREDLEDAHFEDWLMPVNQFSGVHLMLPQLVAMLPFATVKDYEDYIHRLDAVPVVLDKVLRLMHDGMAKGLMPPRFLLERSVAQAEGLAQMTPEASPFAAPLGKFPEAIAPADRDRLRAEVLRAIREHVLPSYGRFTAYLRDEYAPHGRTEVGVWSLPDGDARYAAAVARMTTTKMTPDEIHELGLREVARIEAEQAAIATRLGFADLPSFRAHVLADPALHATSREDILDRYRAYTDQMWGKLPELFGRLPRAKVIVEPVEEFREKEFAGAEYNQGTRDGSRPGRILVNTFEPPKRLTIDMESTAYHEGVPGHHMQISIAQELPELPPFRQQAYYGAFVEGWALYAEQLGKEVGFYQDPYNDYGRLQDEMLRAIRLVVDTGLHARHWTRQQVVDYFHAHSSIDEPSVQAETDRYIVWPGQALAYKVGQLTILRLREQARRELGDRFDIRAFHDQVLGGGALPLDVLEARITAWIAAQKQRSP